jgi:hypothetical protein
LKHTLTHISHEEFILVLKTKKKLPEMPQAASPCPSAIGFASGECRAGLAGGRACS